MFSSTNSALRPRLAAVGRAEHAALRLRPVGVAERADEHDVRIRADGRRCGRCGRSARGPSASTSCRRRSTYTPWPTEMWLRMLASPVPAQTTFGIGRRDRERADRLHRLVVEDRLPVARRRRWSSRCRPTRRRRSRRADRRHAGGRGEAVALRTDVAELQLLATRRDGQCGLGSEEACSGEAQNEQGHAECVPTVHGSLPCVRTPRLYHAVRRPWRPARAEDVRIIAKCETLLRAGFVTRSLPGTETSR